MIAHRLYRKRVCQQ